MNKKKEIKNKLKPKEKEITQNTIFETFIKKYSIKSQNKSSNDIIPKKNNNNKIPEYIKVNILPQGRIKSYSYDSKPGQNLEGIKKINQDSYFILRKHNQIKDFNIFCIMDGHGPDGHFVSSFISKYFSFFFRKNEKINSDLYKQNLDYIYYQLKKDNYSLIKKAYQEAEKDLNKIKQMDIDFSGTSCIILIQLGDKIICANVGNSRAIMVKNYDRIIPLSIDNTPDIPEESERILKHGGIICQIEENENQLGPYRIWQKGEKYPGLDISRSIGDTVASKLGVISEPNIIEKFIDSETQFIVMVSHGVLEFMSNKDILDIVMLFYPKKDSRRACETIINQARKYWYQDDIIVDDITVIVIFF